jgi:hypothetical protein
MDRDDIIRMAREAADATGTLIPAEWNEPLLECFATLIAAHEREACAKVCDEVGKESLSQWPHRLATMIRARGNA